MSVIAAWITYKLAGMVNSKIKPTDVVSNYNGEGDAAEWWKRFETISVIK
ncbi:MAG: hypothetical protein AAF438_20215 [Pseudomonadota bacterium]